jgi:hypothetical protein
VSTFIQAAVIGRSSVPVRLRTAAQPLVRIVPMLAVCAVVIIAPFERRLFTVANTLTVTTVEVAMFVALLAAAVAWLAAGSHLTLRTPITATGALFVALLWVAAVFAPVEQGNALRFAARLTTAAGLFVMALNAIDTRGRARVVVVTMVGVATVVGLVAVLEAAEVPAVMSLLTIFRPGFHVVAGQLRATSTLFYPTIASMYLEVAFAAGLWLLLEPESRYARLERCVVFVALCTIGAGVIATFTRAGLLAMAVSLGVVATLRLLRLPWRAAGIRLLAGLALALAGLVVLLHSPDKLLTRLKTEGSQEWYGARYQAPKSLQFKPGGVYQVPITLTNTGRLVWDSDREPPFTMSYHWLRGGSEAVVQFEGRRTRFSAPVTPGTAITLPVTVVAPGQPGTYTLLWDVVHETRAWLSTEGVTPARTDVRVEGSPTGEVVTTMTRLPRAMVRPTRPELWNAAIRMAADHPLLGVGPDNYRHMYGSYIGLARWDARVHANNMYLEVLAGAGLLGLGALLALTGAAGWALWRRWALADQPLAAALAAMLAVWLVVAGHGVVDSFLSFTTTYVMFALAAGLAFSRAFTVEGDR